MPDADINVPAPLDAIATAEAAATGTRDIGIDRLVDLDDPVPVMEALRGVIDPELGINLVDLGLVYDVAVSDGIAYITLTVTTPACPLGNYLEDQVRWAVLKLPGILGVEVEMVLEPRWSPALMSDAARRTLGWTG